MQKLRFLAAFAASAVFFVSSLASALPIPEPGCGTGPACAYGFECTQVGTDCAPSAPCASGEACPAAEPCTTTVEYGCVPARCAVDSDCSSGMVCHAWPEPCAITDCACPPNTPSCSCGSTACDPQTVSLCTPRYDVPCKVAADCGPGFICEQAQSCGCASARMPTPAAGGTGGSPGAVPPDCSCQPSAQMQCVAMDITCQTAAECPAGWTCEVEEVAAGAPACAAGADCAAPAAASSKCLPPYYGAQSGGDLEVPASPTSGTESGSAGGESASTTSTSAPNKDTPAPASTGSGESHNVAACAMGRASASSDLLPLLALLGALFSLSGARRYGARRGLGRPAAADREFGVELTSPARARVNAAR